MYSWTYFTAIILHKSSRYENLQTDRLKRILKLFSWNKLSHSLLSFDTYMKICSWILSCPFENCSALFNAFWPSCKFHVLDIDLEVPYGRSQIEQRNNITDITPEKRLQTDTGKITICTHQSWIYILKS